MAVWTVTAVRYCVDDARTRGEGWAVLVLLLFSANIAVMMASLLQWFCFVYTRQRDAFDLVHNSIVGTRTVSALVDFVGIIAAAFILPRASAINIVLQVSTALVSQHLLSAVYRNNDIPVIKSFVAHIRYLLCYLAFDAAFSIAVAEFYNASTTVAGGSYGIATLAAFAAVIQAYTMALRIVRITITNTKITSTSAAL